MQPSAGGRSLQSLLAELLLPEIALGLVYLVTALLAIAATRANEVALMWPCNAIAAGVLIRLPEVRWVRAAGALFAACLMANSVSGSSLPLASAMSLVNLFEIAAMVLVFRVLVRYPYPDISIAQATVMTVVAGVVITGITAMLGAVVLHLMMGARLEAGVLNWWASDAIGACLLMPPIILCSRRKLRQLVRPAHARGNALTLLACLAWTYACIRYLPFPFVIVVIGPMMAAFRLGGFGTAVVSAFTSLLVIGMWMSGIRPNDMLLSSAAGVLDGFPFIALIAAAMPPIAVGLGTDARRSIARAFKSSERRFRESLDHSPLGVILMDRSGQMTYANAVLQDMLGYNQSELVKMNIRSIIHPDDLEDMLQAWYRLVSGSMETCRATRRFGARDSSWIWVHSAASIARDDDGTPLHIIVQVESMEERRHAEAQLAQEREFLHITLNSIGDAVITADAEGRVNYMNVAAQELSGMPLGKAAGSLLPEVLPLTEGSAGVAAANIIESCRNANAFVKREEACNLVRPDGSTCFISDSATPVLDTDGKLNGFVVVLHDVTRSLQHTRELRHRADHDGLTGLLNRAAFDLRLHQCFTRSRRSGTACSLVMVDLDLFKSVNDTGGHAAGDAVLEHVSAVLKRSVRREDVVGRLGGDEFAVLLEDCPPDRAWEIGTRLRDVLNPLATDHENLTHVTGASLGMAHLDGAHADPDEWARAADEACYEGKRAGHGRLVIWDPAQPTAPAGHIRNS